MNENIKFYYFVSTRKKWKDCIPAFPVSFSLSSSIESYIHGQWSSHNGIQTCKTTGNMEQKSALDKWIVSKCFASRFAETLIILNSFTLNEYITSRIIYPSLFCNFNKPTIEARTYQLTSKVSFSAN